MLASFVPQPDIRPGEDGKGANGVSIAVKVERPGDNSVRVRSLCTKAFEGSIRKAPGAIIRRIRGMHSVNRHQDVPCILNQPNHHPHHTLEGGLLIG